MGLSAFAVMELAKPYTEEVMVWLIEVTHPTAFASKFRFARNALDVVSRGETYTAWAFDVILPDEIGSEITPARFTVGDLDTFDDQGQPVSFWTLIRHTVPIELGPIRIKLEMVFASDPDTPHIVQDGYRWTNPQRAGAIIEGDLVGGGFLLDGVQAKNRRMTPGNLPGLFR